MRCVLPELASVNGMSSGMGGVQFQANVLSSGNGRSISRGSVRREGKHRPHRPVEVREIAQTCERGGEGGGG